MYFLLLSAVKISYLKLTIHPYFKMTIFLTKLCFKDWSADLYSLQSIALSAWVKTAHIKRHSMD